MSELATHGSGITNIDWEIAIRSAACNVLGQRWSSVRHVFHRFFRAYPGQRPSSSRVKAHARAFVADEVWLDEFVDACVRDWDVWSIQDADDDAALFMHPTNDNRW